MPGSASRGGEHRRAACRDQRGCGFDVEDAGRGECGVLAEAVPRVGTDEQRARILFDEERVHHDLQREGRDLGPIGAPQRVVVGAQQQVGDVVT